MENKTIKILAIDDNQDNLTSLKALIKEVFPRMTILTSLDGNRGLELALAEDPDVILLDILMPDMDGFTVCRRLKADKKLADIPVVFLTALKEDRESRIRALEAGGEAFVSKPLDISELTAQIRAMLKIRTANIEKRDEQHRLAALVEEQTQELKNSYKATLNLLEDLRTENAARKITEQEVRESEEKYKTLIEITQDAVFINQEGRITYLNQAALKLFGAEHHAQVIGKSPFDLFHPDYHPVVKKHIDMMLQQGVPPELIEEKIVRLDGNAVDVEVTATPFILKGSQAIQMVLRDITGRKLTEKRIEKQTRDLVRVQEALIGSMAILAEFRDTETGAHIQRTKFYVKLLTRNYFDQVEVLQAEPEWIWQSAPLHDIGKVAIPDSILFKPGSLTTEEFNAMKMHTVYGCDVIMRAEQILGENSFLDYAKQITKSHHEKWDGTGYPQGLKGEEIPITARIMAIADVYDALISERPYKKPVPHETTVNIIKEAAGRQFDPHLVEIFLEHQNRFEQIARQFKDKD